MPRMRGRDGTRATRVIGLTNRLVVFLWCQACLHEWEVKKSRRASSWSRSKGFQCLVHGEQHSCTHARIWLDGHRSGLAYRSL